MKGTVDMIELNYQLNKNDILDYYQVVLSRASETKTSRLLAFVWGPILLFTIPLGLKLIDIYKNWFLAISAVLSLIWVLFIYPLLFQDLCRKAAEKNLLKSKPDLSLMNIKEEDGNLFVNGTKKEITNCYGTANTVIVTFTDDAKLIIPERVFDHNEEMMRTFIRDILMKLKTKEES